MENNYLIPANTKKSQLILGFFTLTDLVIFIVGCIWTLAMVLLIGGNNIFVLILELLPLLIGAFLVVPVLHYHNILQLLTNIVNYYIGRKKYYWKGWCSYERFTRNGE